MGKFTFYRQLDKMDCGPTCLRMITKFYGKDYPIQTLRDLSNTTQQGASLKSIMNTAIKLGIDAKPILMSFENLDDFALLPCILHWNQNHFVVLPPQNYNRNNEKEKILIADPAFGMVKVTQEAFLKAWSFNGSEEGYVLHLEPTSTFGIFDPKEKKTLGLISIFKYLKPYKQQVFLILLGMALISAFSLITPFLTQSIVDIGINQADVNFIYLMFYSQLFIFIGTTIIESLRAWAILHVSSRINISLVSLFLRKLMKLPMSYFDGKFVGDIMQRVFDHNRIDQFLTTTILNTLFSLINLIAFSIILALYDLFIFGIFITGSVVSIIWILFFMKKRKHLDYERFASLGDNQNNIVETISGMQDIKLNNAEKFQQWKWERTQATLFNVNLKSLSIGQYQNIGYSFFIQLKNIIISFVAAKSVVEGDITMGMMLSISYITGQLNSPINQLLSFFQSAQDSKLSLERLSEVHLKDDEDVQDLMSEVQNNFVPSSESLIIKDLSFRFGSEESPLVIRNINLNIPAGKVTAVVGVSGSGKTTLMKLLLKFHKPSSGNIFIGENSLQDIPTSLWRSYCGAVFSDGYIFSTSLAQNITINETVDEKKLIFAARMSRVDEFVDDLPLKYFTKIGSTGHSLSSGQRQRILIARAVYKEPNFLFLDEATNTLDANTEKAIHSNLSNFFSGRTVFIIAHRLSTVKQADQILVMEKGEIVERGNHSTLIKQKGQYYELVKNQLDLEG